MEKLLVLGTAPDDYLRLALERIKVEYDAQIHLVVAQERAANYVDQNLTVFPIQGRINWKQGSLFRYFRRLRPQTVIIVRGGHWFHDNVVQTLGLWTAVGRKPRITCMRGKDYQDILQLNGEHPLVTTAVFTILITGCLSPLVTAGATWWFPVGLLLAELGFRAFENMYRYMGPRYQKSLNQPRLHRTVDGCQQTHHHPKYGWSNIPHFRKTYGMTVHNLKLPTHHWTTQHDEQGCRLTSDHAAAFQDKEEIAVFGCSISYGFGLDMPQSYPWLLQKRFQDYNIRNYGVGAWSLYQMWLLLQDRFEKDKPKAVVLGFHQELELRATNSFAHRAHWLHYLKNPACVTRNGKRRCYKPSGYQILPFSVRIRTLALMQYGINRLRYAGRTNPRMMRETTESLLLDFKRYCGERDIQLLVVCVDDSEQYYRFFRDNYFSWCISGVSSKDLERWTLYPVDGHPNEKAHQQIAEVAGNALDKMLNNKNATPEAEYLKDLLPERESASDLRYIYPHF